MNKFFILLLLLGILSCQKEEPKKKATPIVPSAPRTVIRPEGKALPVDSLLLVPYNSKNLKEFYKSSGYKTVWQSKKNRKNEKLQKAQKTHSIGFVQQAQLFAQT